MHSTVILVIDVTLTVIVCNILVVLWIIYVTLHCDVRNIGDLVLYSDSTVIVVIWTPV